MKSSNNVVLFLLRVRPDAVSSAARTLDAFRGAVLRRNRDHWLDMKKERNKVVVRQSVMNWVEDGAEDFVALMHRARSMMLRMRLYLLCQWCTLLSRRSCPNSLPSSWSMAEACSVLHLLEGLMKNSKKGSPHQVCDYYLING